MRKKEIITNHFLRILFLLIGSGNPVPRASLLPPVSDPFPLCTFKEEELLLVLLFMQKRERKNQYEGESKKLSLEGYLRNYAARIGRETSIGPGYPPDSLEVLPRVEEEILFQPMWETPLTKDISKPLAYKPRKRLIKDEGIVDTGYTYDHEAFIDGKRI